MSLRRTGSRSCRSTPTSASQSDASLPDAALARWNLEAKPFALFVSTIESRKNHVSAFEAWGRLVRAHPAESIPRLVCVGRSGWMNDAAFALLEADADARAAVTIIPQVSDEELALLYRSCAFTIYPSFYEGWGLPVTESLCYGKIPLVADNSSLPEAGAGFALLFETNATDALVSAVEKVVFDEAWREAEEARIAHAFAPRPWAAIAAQIDTAINRFLGDAPPIVAAEPARADLGLFYPTTLYKDAPIWNGLASGEIYRSGDGWLWPEPLGCRTKPQGGTLRIRLDPVNGSAAHLCAAARACAAALLLHDQRQWRADRLGHDRARGRALGGRHAGR